MREANIHRQIEGRELNGCVRYPDEWCFAFNPNYVEVAFNNIEGGVTVEVRNRYRNIQIEVFLYHDRGKVYISRMLQLLFDDYKIHRSEEMSIFVRYKTYILFSVNLFVVWGGLDIGEQFGEYGAFAYTGGQTNYIRNVRWYKQFPFTVSLFRTNENELLRGKCDNGEYKEVNDNFAEDAKFAEDDFMEIEDEKLPANVTGELQYISAKKTCAYFDEATEKYYAMEESTLVKGTQPKTVNVNGTAYKYNAKTKEFEEVTFGNRERTGIFEVDPSDIFPTAKNKVSLDIILKRVTTGLFNFDFNMMFPNRDEEVHEIVNLTIIDDSNGYYLRWIDKYGMIQYVLLERGEIQRKNKLSSNSIVQEDEYNGVLYNSSRTAQVTNQDTIECCAVNLTKSELGYVKTIISSPHIDLYKGKDVKGKEIWMPVVIAADTYKIKPNEELVDFEIKLSLPATTTQII